MEEVVAREWNKVKGVSSLYQNYGCQRDYAKWRYRFLKAGYVSKTKRTWAKAANPKEHILAYQREYYRKWRSKNKAKAKEHTHNYWKRRFLSEIQVCLNLNS